MVMECSWLLLNCSWLLNVSMQLGFACFACFAWGLFEFSHGITQEAVVELLILWKPIFDMCCLDLKHYCQSSTTTKSNHPWHSSRVTTDIARAWKKTSDRIAWKHVLTFNLLQRSSTLWHEGKLSWVQTSYRLLYKAIQIHLGMIVD